MLDSTPPDELVPHRFTRDEYARVVETGALDDLRVELLRGVIVEMIPDGRLPEALAELIDAMHGGLTPHRFTRDEYERVVDSGALSDMRVELLRGAIVDMSPTGELHDTLVGRLNKLLVQAFGDDAEVRPQSGLAATQDSVPQPDLAVIPPRARMVRPRSAWLVVEVAVSSRTRDLRVKAAMYAEAGVEEYWVVDAKKRFVVVMRDPSGAAYETHARYVEGQVVRLARRPSLTVDVAELFA